MSPEKRTAKPFHGVVVPMVTPLKPDLELDEQAVRLVVDHLIKGGVHGIFVLGTTGEMPSLPNTMRRRLVELTTEHAGDRVKTYAGVADHSLEEAVRSADAYASLGIDAVVVLPPFYYPLDPGQAANWLRLFADRTSCSVILYNMPKVTHASIPIEVLEELAADPDVAGLKDSDSDISRLKAVLETLGGRQDFSFFTGMTVLAGEALRLGADGMVPSVGNVVPRTCVQLYEYALIGKWDAVDQLQRKLDVMGQIYHAGYGLGQSMAALKAVMNMKGLCGPTVMPPLRTLSIEEQEEVRRGMEEAGVM